jgi:hypothetical protein
MLRLELTNVPAFLANFNPRAEKNGEETRPAADLALQVNIAASDVLPYFAPTLNHFLFDEKGTRDLADGLPRRFTALPSIHWDDEMTGATFSLHHGVGKPIVFEDAKVNKFVIEPVDGGSIKLSLRVQVHPDEKQAGKLSQLIQSDVEISLQPGELPTMGEDEK